MIWRGYNYSFSLINRHLLCNYIHVHVNRTENEELVKRIRHAVLYESYCTVQYCVHANDFMNANGRGWGGKEGVGAWDTSTVQPPVQCTVLTKF